MGAVYQRVASVRLGSEFDSPRDNFRLARRKLCQIRFWSVGQMPRVLHRRHNRESGPGAQITDHQAHPSFQTIAFLVLI
jgi:hypothetical protein